MNKLYKENGFLSKEGRALVSPLEGALEAILSSPDVKDMSESELRTLGGSLSKIVGDAISNTIVNKSDIQNKLNAMTDAQFESYMTVKYGKNWIFHTATSEELSRCKSLASNKMEDVVDRMRAVIRNNYGKM